MQQPVPVESEPEVIEHVLREQHLLVVIFFEEVHHCAVLIVQDAVHLALFHEHAH